jgi:hypothetical protein
VLLTGVGASGERTVVHDVRGEVELTAPGFMGRRWGGVTPLGVLMGHVLYGSWWR